MDKAEILEYVHSVARSIEENIERFIPEEGKDDKIKKLADGIKTFYISLFDRRKGTIQ